MSEASRVVTRVAFERNLRNTLRIWYFYRKKNEARRIDWNRRAFHANSFFLFFDFLMCNVLLFNVLRSVRYVSLFLSQNVYQPMYYYSPTYCVIHKAWNGICRWWRWTACTSCAVNGDKRSERERHLNNLSITPGRCYLKMIRSCLGKETDLLVLHVPLPNKGIHERKAIRSVLSVLARTTRGLRVMTSLNGDAPNRVLLCLRKKKKEKKIRGSYGASFVRGGPPLRPNWK